MTREYKVVFVSRTQMQVEARIQPHPTSMSNKVLRCPEGSEVLIALPDRLVGAAAILAIGHQHRDLRAQLRQLKGACTNI